MPGNARRATGPRLEHSSAVAAAIARRLREWRDPARATDIQRYFKESVVSLGIGTPVVRTFVAEQLKALRPGWTATQAIPCCDQLLREPEFEVRGAGILVLAGSQRELTVGFLPRAESWLGRRLDNWALVDSFCSCVLSPLLGRDPIVAETLKHWSREPGLWVRRAALVTLVPAARRGHFLDLAYGLAREHFGDPEDLMHKATGWLLREAGKTDAGRLREFLLRHGPAIPRTALRYAIERFPAPERGQLLHATRAPG